MSAASMCSLLPEFKIKYFLHFVSTLNMKRLEPWSAQFATMIVYCAILLARVCYFICET